jgi:hypothetical protein
MSIFEIGSIQASPGQKKSGYCSVQAGAAEVRFPILLANGSQAGTRLALTAGVHPREFLGIEALRSLMKGIDPEKLKGQVAACILPSYLSSLGCQPGVPQAAEINLNRIFPGNLDGNPAERSIAWLFENVIRPSDVYIDLHSGGVSEGLISMVAYRTSGNPNLDRRALELAEAFGLEDVVRGKSPSGGNSHAAATRENIVALLVDVGQYGTRSPILIDQVREGVLRAMETLGMLELAHPKRTQPPRHWTWTAEAEATVEGLWMPQFEVGEDVQEGAILGHIVDPLDNLLSTVIAPASGRVLYGERGLIVTQGDILAAIAGCED